MCKSAWGAVRRLVARALQVRVTTAGAWLLALVTLVQLFATPGTRRYPALPLSDIDHELYRHVSPNYIKKTNQDCDYQEIIHSKKTLNTWQLPSKFDDFTSRGLANGSYIPSHCNPLVSVAILVTYRNRQKQLDVFLPYMHNFLRKQNIHYKIYIIEQQDDKPWNKGLLYNIGARYAIADKFPCLILHDVDLLPLDEANLYACFSQPRHMSAAVDKLRYVLTYPQLIGGVLAIRTDQYTAVNGFSNQYEGWGGEDDDFYYRLEDEGFKILRLAPEVSRYCMVPHAAATPNPAAHNHVRAERAAGPSAKDKDGLRSASYSTLRLAPHPLFTLILAGADEGFFSGDFFVRENRSLTTVSSNADERLKVPAYKKSPE